MDQHVPLEQASITSLIEKRLKQAIQNTEQSRKPAKRAPGGLSKKGRKCKEEEGYGELEDHSEQKLNEDADDSPLEEESDNASFRSESEQLLIENPASRQSQSFSEDSATSVSSVEQESVGKRLRNALAVKITAESEEAGSDDEWW